MWTEPVATVSTVGWMLTGLFVKNERFAQEYAMGCVPKCIWWLFFFSSKDDITSLHGFYLCATDGLLLSTQRYKWPTFLNSALMCLGDNVIKHHPLVHCNQAKVN